MANLSKKEILEKLRSWRADPVLFVKEVFKAEPEEWQAKALRALPEEDKIAIKSGHGVGKSTLLAWAILWFLCTHAPAKVPCTAPTAHQLKDILWSELQKWVMKMPTSLKNSINLTSDRCAISEDTFAVARTARKENPDAFQGFHADNLLFIGDEASGIEEVIFEVAQGALSTKGAKIIITGNPTKTSGYFHRAFNANRNLWKRFTVSCMDSTRVSQKYIDDCAAEYGEDSNFYRVRVLGEFPTSGDMQFISTESVEKCMEYQDSAYHIMPYQAGLDIARHGDDSSVFVLRQGRKVHLMERYRIDDLTTLSSKIAELVKKCPEIQQLSVDTVGMGIGVYDILNKWGYGDILQMVNAGEKAFDEHKYLNKRAEMWDKMRQAIKEGIDLPNDEMLKSDLTGIQYDYDARQRLVLEKKSDMKKRGLSSPDMADALALTYAYELSPEARDEPFTNNPLTQLTDWSTSDYI